MDVCELHAADARDAADALLDEDAARCDAIGEMIGSPMLEDDRAFVRALYRAVLSRDPDGGGARRWSEHLSAGGSRFDLLAELAASAEARAHGVSAELQARALETHRRAIYRRYWRASDGADDVFLRELHLAVLGRAASPDWLRANARELAGGYSRAEVAAALVLSEEATELEMPTDWV
jgi:hypothetical protein